MHLVEIQELADFNNSLEKALQDFIQKFLYVLCKEERELLQQIYYYVRDYESFAKKLIFKRILISN